MSSNRRSEDVQIKNLQADLQFLTTCQVAWELEVEADDVACAEVYLVYSSSQ